MRQIIINDQHRFIFIHVPKTGGNSVKAVLTGNRHRAGAHRRLSSLRNQCYGYYSFGFVRNPWDRMVSLYHFCIQKPKTHKGYKPEIERAGFKHVLLNACLDTGQKDAMWYLDGVDDIGRFESFQKDFDRICEKIGVPKSNLPRKNASTHNSYREYYDQEMIDHVAKAHRHTIEQFGYNF